MHHGYLLYAVFLRWCLIPYSYFNYVHTIVKSGKDGHLPDDDGLKSQSITNSHIHHTHPSVSYACILTPFILHNTSALKRSSNVSLLNIHIAKYTQPWNSQQHPSCSSQHLQQQQAQLPFRPLLRPSSVKHHHQLQPQLKQQQRRN